MSRPFLMSDATFKRVATFADRRDSTCTRKVAFPSRKAARYQLKLMRRSGETIGATLEAYACGFCSCWHLGNRVGAPWEE